jgi:hypothetical protein
MKKSQIFLGASAFVLAIAGAFASKASHRDIKHTICTKQTANSHCGAKIAFTTVQASGHLQATVGTDHALVYSCVSTGPVLKTKCGRALFSRPARP